MADQSLLAQILAGLEQTNPSAAAQLRSEIEQAGDPAVPEVPPTLLDEVRQAGLDAVELTVSELVAQHELPAVVGRLVKWAFDADQRIADLEAKGHSTAPPAPAPAGEPAAAPTTSTEPPTPAAGVGSGEAPAPPGSAPEPVSPTAPEPAQWPATEPTPGPSA